MLVTLSHCKDNSVLSSQYVPFVNQKSVQLTAITKQVRDWLQCCSMCPGWDSRALATILLRIRTTESSPYTCETKSLPFVEFLKVEDNDCVYYDLRMKGADVNVRTDACLPGYDDDIIHGVSFDQCWRECLAAGVANCSSIDYNHDTETCFLGRSSLADVGVSLMEPCGADDALPDRQSYTYLECRFFWRKEREHRTGDEQFNWWRLVDTFSQ